MDSSKFIKTSVLALAVSTALLSSAANAIAISVENDASVLTDALIIPNSGLTVTSSSLTGVSGQSGTFTNSDGTYGLAGEGGLVFSTGNVADYESGPNTRNNFSTGWGTSASSTQNAILSEITGQSVHRDPVELNITFDVDSSVDTISFVAAFGSEEYPEYVSSSFVDGFALLLNDENVAGAQLSGAVAGDPLYPITINHPDFANISGTELDGMLAPNGIPLLRFDIPVTPGSTGNTFTMLLADASDSAYDTTIYLSSFGNFESESGSSEFTPLMPDPSNPTDANGGFVFVLPEVEANETIWIDPDVSTGYTYTATGGGLFASVTAPTLLSVNDGDGYEVVFINEFGLEETVALLAGQTFTFDFPVSSFTIQGIDENLMLDPTDPTAFVTGVSFSAGGSYGVVQTPVTTTVGGGINVPEPATLAMLAMSLFGFRQFRRK